MSQVVVKVPASLLLNPVLRPSAKLVWMVSCSETSPLSYGLLSTKTGLSSPTVVKAIVNLTAAGCFSTGFADQARPISPVSFGPNALIPVALLRDFRVKVLARVLYGVLQLTPGYGNQVGQFTYASLSKLVGMAHYTVKMAVHDLVINGWVKVTQSHQHRPVAFMLSVPAVVPGNIALAAARKRLRGVNFGGETLMREYLSLLVDSSECDDNATPHFLINPFTDQPLQLDRYYWCGVAFEFNGAQHYTETEFSSSKDLRKQQARDSMKEGFCRRMGVSLVIVHGEDLSLVKMQQKVGNLLPLRDLLGYGALARFLDLRGTQYRRGAERAKMKLKLDAKKGKRKDP